MQGFFNPFDWYWTIDGSTTLVYSSARNIYVPINDADFVAWLANNGAAPKIGAEADIWPHVSVRLPEWLFDGKTFAQPSVGNYMPAQLQAYAASVRYNHEIAGTTLNGVSVATDRQSQAMIAGAYNMASRDSTFKTQWKTGVGTFATLDAPAIIAISVAVGGHVAACFAKESDVAAAIAGGTIKTLSDIDAAFAGV